MHVSSNLLFVSQYMFLEDKPEKLSHSLRQLTFQITSHVEFLSPRLVFAITLYISEKEILRVVTNSTQGHHLLSPLLIVAYRQLFRQCYQDDMTPSFALTTPHTGSPCSPHTYPLLLAHYQQTTALKALLLSPS
ncbi:hypothetical protein ES332_A10G232900v1 [Gossypium tomentosum]|uniref:Uncharacterized protein n=1 Tax=Gossypium tomentosum TaxID=34277 RepID=A0A5D2NTS3_GOSTO|nr:hypothetical protein ES332_A10G232900v1 [Gossypium tomentosum]